MSTDRPRHTWKEKGKAKVTKGRKVESDSESDDSDVEDEVDFLPVRNSPDEMAELALSEGEGNSSKCSDEEAFEELLAKLRERSEKWARLKERSRKTARKGWRKAGRNKKKCVFMSGGLAVSIAVGAAGAVITEGALPVAIAVPVALFTAKYAGRKVWRNTWVRFYCRRKRNDFLDCMHEGRQNEIQTAWVGDLGQYMQKAHLGSLTDRYATMKSLLKRYRRQRDRIKNCSDLARACFLRGRLLKEMDEFIEVSRLYIQFVKFIDDEVQYLSNVLEMHRREITKVIENHLNDKNGHAGTLPATMGGMHAEDLSWAEGGCTAASAFSDPQFKRMYNWGLMEKVWGMLSINFLARRTIGDQEQHVCYQLCDGELAAPVIEPPWAFVNNLKNLTPSKIKSFSLRKSWVDKLEPVERLWNDAANVVFRGHKTSTLTSDWKYNNYLQDLTTVFGSLGQRHAPHQASKASARQVYGGTVKEHARSTATSAVTKIPGVALGALKEAAKGGDKIIVEGAGKGCMTGGISLAGGLAVSVSERAVTGIDKYWEQRRVRTANPDSLNQTNLDSLRSLLKTHGGFAKCVEQFSKVRFWGRGAMYILDNKVQNGKLTSCVHAFELAQAVLEFYKHREHMHRRQWANVALFADALEQLRDACIRETDPKAAAGFAVAFLRSHRKNRCKGCCYAHSAIVDAADVDASDIDEEAA